MGRNFVQEITELEVNDNYNKFKSLYDEINRVYSNYLKRRGIVFDKSYFTGNDDCLLKSIKESINKAKNIDIIVSFLMESGVRLIVGDLNKAVKRGAKLRILTGAYLNITQPSALYLIKDMLGEAVELRMYNIKSKSFHPKAYIFEYENGGDIFIGSSNISSSALNGGVEWNCKIDKTKDEFDFSNFKDEFENLFNNHSNLLDDEELKRYSMNWRRPKVFDSIIDEKKEKIIEYPRPRGAQIEALYELKKARKEGMDRALVVAATGIGKTYLAAFDSTEFKKVLFVAHREEILNQAKRSFENVRRGIKCGFFNAENKNIDSDILFASVQSFGKEEYLNEEYFKRNEFDYIIIDEFHHAVAGNYIKIINYFTPKFLLGLTATPERLDNKDVFALCHYNVVYEARLKDAINKGWLVPFRYYGIYDETDYNKIEYKNGKYNEKQLEEALMIHKRAELILNHYKKYNSKRCLGFSSSKNHAEYMARYFCKNGVKACSVISNDRLENTLGREEAIKKLNSGELKVIFSVDMFNEGLDIPSIDMVMFLRPTQSPTVFLQQLGRGLRKSVGKKYLNVLDFIGNYKKVNLIPFFLTGDIREYQNNNSRRLPKEEDYPDDCIVQFDFKIIDIFKKQEKALSNIFNLIVDDYYRIKELLNTKPLRLNMFTYMDDELYEIMRKTNKYNIFNDYLDFLKKIGELNDEEKKFFDTKGARFINTLEKTLMSRSYKIPLLLAFYNNGKIKMELNDDDIYHSFRVFYSFGINGIDLMQDKGGQNYRQWTKEDYLRIAQSPKEAFMNSAKEYFIKHGNLYCLNNELKLYINDRWFTENFKDIIDFKTRSYYKNRLVEKYKKDQIEIKYALRDEKINIFAMTEGNLPSRYSNQILICKKQSIPENRRIFLLDAKRTTTIYMLSKFGEKYMDSIKNIDYNHNYVAIVDSQIKIKVSREIFEALNLEGFFSIWEPDSPVKYFENQSEGYIVLFRVYKIKDNIDEEILENGRHGRNYYFRLSEIITTGLENPVIDNNTFIKMKEEIISILKSRNSLINIE